MSGDDQRAAEVPDARQDLVGRWTEMHDECHVVVDRLRAELAETRAAGDAVADAARDVVELNHWQTAAAIEQLDNTEEQQQ